MHILRIASMGTGFDWFGISQLKNAITNEVVRAIRNQFHVLERVDIMVSSLGDDN